MRGRPSDPTRARAKARAHAKRGHYCDCGRKVFGNGGKANHEGMHRRRGDGHRWMSSDAWSARFKSSDPEPCTCKHDKSEHRLVESRGLSPVVLECRYDGCGCPFFVPTSYQFGSTGLKGK